MRIDTQSGLHGTLIEYRADQPRTYEGEAGIALVLRDDAPYPNRPYSTHRIYRSQIDGALMAESGDYDMTLAQAEADFERRARERVIASAA